MSNTDLVELRCMGCMRMKEEQGKCHFCGFEEESHISALHHLPPRTILAGKYLVGRVIGEGGFGITYIGWDLNLDIKIAIKEYYPTGFVTRESTATHTVMPYTGENEEFFLKGREKFVNEAKSLARFYALPGIVSVKDFFLENGTAYIVMEFVEGETLKARLERTGGRLPAQQVFEMMKPLMRSLFEVHKAGIIHRDISPDNVMITKEENVKLLDFGAARDFAGSGNRSMSVLLKPGYAPEEQYRSRGVQGPWTDVYALAATMYRAVTGITPDESNERLLKDEVKTPSQLGVSITPQQEYVLMKGMAVLQNDRFQSVEELSAALFAHPGEHADSRPVQVSGSMQSPETVKKAEEPVPAAGLKLPITAAKPGGRKKLWSILGAAAAAAVILIIVLVNTQNQPVSGLKQTAPTAASSASMSQNSAPLPSGTSTAAAPSVAQNTKLNIGLYADGADSYYQVLYDALQACADADPACNWTIDYRVGQNTAEEQIRTVEDFIAAQYDAVVVIQNSSDAASECIAQCKTAGIPYFGACHSFVSASNAADAAGSCCYDFLQAGYYAGQDASARNVKEVIIIEGQLGRDSASAQTYGFLKAYEDAGKSLGGVSADDLATLKDAAEQNGAQDIEVVGWASGGWFADPAQAAMSDYIDFFAPDGFEGVYAANDPMMEGVLAALTDAGLNPSDYWLGSCNGREIAWDWVKNGVITMDVSHSACLEGDTIYQQIKAYFTGQSYKKYVHPKLTPYNIDNIGIAPLVPFSDVNAYMEWRAKDYFSYDISGPEWVEIEGF